MLTSQDLPALLDALRARQPRAGWVEGEHADTYHSAQIPRVVVLLPTPELAELHLDGSLPDLYILSEGYPLPITSDASVEVVADAICEAIRTAIADHATRLDHKQAALEALRDLTELDPPEGVTAESASRLVAALTPPDATEVGWRAVPLVGVSAAALLTHHGNPHKVAYALKVATGLPVSSGPGLIQIKGTYAQALRAGEALAALSNIAEAMLQARTHEAA